MNQFTLSNGDQHDIHRILAIANYLSFPHANKACEMIERAMIQQGVDSANTGRVFTIEEVMEAMQKVSEGGEDIVREETNTPLKLTPDEQQKILLVLNRVEKETIAARMKMENAISQAREKATK